MTDKYNSGRELEESANSLNTTQEKAMKNAFASARMEGYRVTPEIEEYVKRMLLGELTIKDFVNEKILLKKGCD